MLLISWRFKAAYIGYRSGCYKASVRIQSGSAWQYWIPPHYYWLEICPITPSLYALLTYGNMPVQPRFRVKFLLKFKYENVVRLAFQKKFYSKTRLDGHITIREKSVFRCPVFSLKSPPGIFGIGCYIYWKSTMDSGRNQTLKKEVSHSYSRPFLMTVNVNLSIVFHSPVFHYVPPPP